MKQRGLKHTGADFSIGAAAKRAGSIPAASSPEELRKIILQTRADVEATIQEFGLQQEQ